jgi:hypothetical protein
MSAFSYSRWLSRSDGVGQGYSIHVTTADLFSDLQRRQENVRVSKEAASLICPSIFGKPLQLPDHLSAMGITVDAPVRTKNNALGCRGLLLDLENGDMTPHDFGMVFPELEFIAYSSWSHTPTAPRYRIGLPSTQFVPPDIQVLLLHIIVDRLEAAGWGDALADGKKHGVDIGKLHEAAMFYLPSKRPDCFTAHFHEGRRPLNPSEWISLVETDLLVSPPPPVPTEVYDLGIAPTRSDLGMTGQRTSSCNGRSTIGVGADAYGAGAGHSYGCLQSASRKPDATNRRWRISSTNKRVMPLIPWSVALRSMHCCEITKSSPQNVRHDDEGGQDIRRLGCADLSRQRQEPQTPSTAHPAVG